MPTPTSTKFKLHSPNFMSFREDPVPSPGRTAGVMFLTGGVVCVPPEDAATGDPGVCIFQAERITLEKKTGESHAVMDVLYYDTATSKLTKTNSTADVKCARCLVAAGTNDTEVEVVFDGRGI